MKKQNVQTSLVQDDYISFKTECDCFAHDLKVTFEKDSFGFYNLRMNDNIFFEEDFSGGTFKRIYSRIKLSLTVLFRGYIEFDYEFVFKGKEHVEEFLDYMNEAYKEIRKND